MTIDQENFVITLTDEVTTKEQWLAVMQFGMDTLLKSPRLLMECIVRRAEKMRQECDNDHVHAADYASQLIALLGLEFQRTQSPSKPTS